MRYLLLGTFLLLLAVGCGSQSSEPHGSIQEFQGQVDTSLPPEQQQRQAALKKVLDEIWRGTLPGEVESQLAGLKVNIDTAAFYGKAIGVEKWGFKGPPDGEFQTAAITFKYEDLVQRKIDLKVEDRMFRITGAPGNFVVQLVP
jgi:hypothetical protein